MWKQNNLLFAEKSNPVTESFRAFVVPIMLFTSSMIMAIAWLGHLKFNQFPLIWAILCSWLLVLPEYVINIVAIRLGYKVYTGAQMAAFRLCSGVICVALVSRLLLGEDLGIKKLFGFGLMIIAMVFISRKSSHTA
ncbi:DMT family protein [Moorena sp. SIO4E2]|uniref:DMT family protein n=1 Tax=Moorena sp. SIO4E2 TaxID=2607826 RepID=UPI00258000B3|nr:DMT family protein [Moorena sp. SIO4E2]